MLKVLSFIGTIVKRIRVSVYSRSFFKVIYKLINDLKDEELTEELMTNIYDEIAKSFCKKYGLNVPKLILDEELNEAFCGTYSYDTCTIRFNLKNIVKQRKTAIVCLSTDTEIFIVLVLHELRHHWQYHNLKEEYMWWMIDDNRNTYFSLYDKCPLEIDANRFAEYLGTKDDDKVFVSLPLELYKNYHNSKDLDEEIETEHNIRKAIYALNSDLNK
ncbi:hypothetical protein ACTQX2_11465 [Megamonas funiformis]|uniref:hypothetical protein n=1 Tax=Megamonas funiformis TaxID=437897 RepID=UPI003F99D80D